MARFVPFVIVERRCFGNVGGFAPAVPRFRRHDVARSRSAVERSAERETYVVGARDRPHRREETPRDVGLAAFSDGFLRKRILLSG